MKLSHAILGGMFTLSSCTSNNDGIVQNVDNKRIELLKDIMKDRPVAEYKVVEQDVSNNAIKLQEAIDYNAYKQVMDSLGLSNNKADMAKFNTVAAKNKFNFTDYRTKFILNQIDQNLVNSGINVADYYKTTKEMAAIDNDLKKMEFGQFKADSAKYTKFFKEEYRGHFNSYPNAEKLLKSIAKKIRP